MKISSSSLELSSFHHLAYQEEKSESLQVWTSRPLQPQTSTAQATQSSISSTGQALANQASQVAQGDSTENDPFLRMVRLMVEWLTGKPVKVFSAADINMTGSSASSTAAPVSSDAASALQNAAQQAAPQGQAGFGMSYNYHHLQTETENTQVAMNGTVRTSDGKVIDLTLNLSMNRSFSQQTDINIRAGDAKRTDPLVINFGGTAAQLRDQTFSFDLNGDGNKENIAQLASGSGYLAFDRNGNGRIDNGLELFGPATNSGFGELSQLDSDGNGWIDENDATYKKLSVWTPGANSGQLKSLGELQIGALYTGHVSSAFELRGNNNSNLGAISATGLYLHEDGTAGTMQEVDLTA